MINISCLNFNAIFFKMIFKINLKKMLKIIIMIAFCAMSNIKLYGTEFKLVTSDVKVSIVYAKDDRKLDSIVANLLAKDIQRVTGYLPQVFNELSQASGNVIVIGTIQSALIKACSKSLSGSLVDRWESFGYEIKAGKRNEKITNMLIIAGSDIRGTAYGVFGVSEKIGVSPWYWWADVNPVKKKELILPLKSPVLSLGAYFLTMKIGDCNLGRPKILNPLVRRTLARKHIPKYSNCFSG